MAIGSGLELIYPGLEQKGKLFLEVHVEKFGVGKVLFFMFLKKKSHYAFLYC